MVSHQINFTIMPMLVVAYPCFPNFDGQFSSFPLACYGYNWWSPTNLKTWPNSKHIKWIEIPWNPLKSLNLSGEFTIFEGYKFLVFQAPTQRVPAGTGQSPSEVSAASLRRKGKALGVKVSAAGQNAGVKWVAGWWFGTWFLFFHNIWE